MVMKQMKPNTGNREAQTNDTQQLITIFSLFLRSFREQSFDAVHLDVAHPDTYVQLARIAGFEAWIVFLSGISFFWQVRKWG